MERFTDYASRTLGVRIPADYAGFMETYGKRLPEDPVRNRSWIGGLGSTHFVVGTTLAFRSKLPRFRADCIVIGYVGVKAITVNKVTEEIDEYFMLDGRDGRLLRIDSLGAVEKVAESFEEWITPNLLRATLREKYSSNLTVVVFDEVEKAEEARRRLLKLQKKGFVELDDAVVVVKEADGTASRRGTSKAATKRGLAGSVTGLIVGGILFGPLIGAAFGTIAGALSASLADAGIDEGFMQELSQKFQPGCSALFALIRKADPDRVADAFVGFGGKVLVNSVSTEREAAIQALLDSAGGETV